jgi:hypothetical protein
MSKIVMLDLPPTDWNEIQKSNFIIPNWFFRIRNIDLEEGLDLCNY